MDKKYKKWLLVLVFTATLLYTFISLTKILSGRTPDFEVLWYAAKDLPTGNNPYLNPNIFTGVGYPPNSLLYYLPLTYLNLKSAQLLFIIFSLLSLFLVVVLSIKIAFKKVEWKTLLIVLKLVLLSFPTKFTLGMGQNNTIAFLFLLLSFYSYKKDRRVMAGLLLGLVVSLKTVFAFFVLFYLLYKKWDIVVYSFLTILASVVATVFISSTFLYEYYVRIMLPALFKVSGAEVYYNQGYLGFVARLSQSSNTRQFITPILSFITIIMTSAATIKAKVDDEKLAFSLFVITVLLIDRLSWQHHFVWLIFPFVVLANYAINKKEKIYMGILVIAYILVSWNFKNPKLFSDLPSALLLSNAFYGALLLFGLNLFLLLDRSKD